MHEDGATRNVLLILLASLTLGALAGGALFMISPSGDLIGMPVSIWRSYLFEASSCRGSSYFSFSLPSG